MADMKTTSEDADEKRPDAAPKVVPSRGNFGVILVGLLVMSVTPVASYFAVQTLLKPAVQKPTPAQEEKPNPVIMNVDPLLINIAATRMTRVLRIQIHLVLSEAKLEEPLQKMMPMIKDRIMTTTGLRTLDDLESVEGREALKRDIISDINSMIRNRMAGSIQDVAFTEFLIQ